MTLGCVGSKRTAVKGHFFFYALALFWLLLYNKPILVKGVFVWFCFYLQQLWCLWYCSFPTFATEWPFTQSHESLPGRMNTLFPKAGFMSPSGSKWLPG